MLVIDPTAKILNFRASEGPFSNRASFVNRFFFFLLPFRGHGSLRGRKFPPQHLVRSAGAAMSTPGSHDIHAAQGPLTRSARTLAPLGNHSIPANAGWIRFLGTRITPAGRTTGMVLLNATCCAG